MPRGARTQGARPPAPPCPPRPRRRTRAPGLVKRALAVRAHRSWSNAPLQLERIAAAARPCCAARANALRGRAGFAATRPASSTAWSRRPSSARRARTHSPLCASFRTECRSRAAARSPSPLPPPSRTNWTRLVPPSVLTGHVSEGRVRHALRRRRGRGRGDGRRRGAGALTAGTVER